MPPDESGGIIVLKPFIQIQRNSDYTNSFELLKPCIIFPIGISL